MEIAPGVVRGKFIKNDLMCPYNAYVFCDLSPSVTYMCQIKDLAIVLPRASSIEVVPVVLSRVPILRDVLRFW